MLTVILIVVLVVVAGLVAYSLTTDDDAPASATQGRARSLRAAPSTGTSRRVLREPPLPRLPEVERGATTGLPKAYVAIEGTHAELSKPPLWRRAISLGSMGGIVLLLGVLVAGVLGAIIGTSAEILTGTIG